MAIGWFDALATADTYFLTERGVTSAWDDELDPSKTKYIINSYNRIFYDEEYNVPTYADATAAQRVILQKANAEMAIYLIQHLADEDRRKGIQAQGVIKAGIVKEDYYAKWLDKLPVPPEVDKLLSDFKQSTALGIKALERVENEDVDYDAASDFID